MDIPHDLRNGDFEETMNLLTCIMDQEGTMAIEFSFVVLLNACAGIAALRHGDLLQARVEKLGFKNRVIVGNGLINILGKQIAETMDPCDMGTYALLLNIYAKACIWDGVTTIRKMMREIYVKKQARVS
ncbi:hypothetical protein MtrunA17_Chr5g0408271 [Medicago truncatula]|uniref:Uncharacterized protein n=1 Tax=Medicago truncatula TaxID=3880 RepID=A0A396HPY4_MEDTR|nr:hypothetical protein MtrunA17_Chr5g0408271 [Medicago truncatula]